MLCWVEISGFGICGFYSIGGCGRILAFAFVIARSEFIRGGPAGGGGRASTFDDLVWLIYTCELSLDVLKFQFPS